MSNAIEINNLTKIYHLYNSPLDRVKEALHPRRKKYHQDFYALNDLSLSIKTGETVGIIGQNGAGKSTLLKVITGVLTESAGQVSVKGKIAALLELGTGFNPEMTGIENIFFNGSLMGYTKDEMEERLPKILDFADIGDFVNHPVKMYSSGMFARLAFAVAINVDPDILIVDEALSVGDMTFQARCFAKFKEFQEAGKTILFVTHSLDTVIRYCQRAILIDSGSKVSEGSPKEVVDTYKKLQVNLHLAGNNEQQQAALPQADTPPAGLLKSHMAVNKDATTYGNGMADIVDFALLDKNNQPCQKLFHGDEFSVMIKVKFNEQIDSPIFAYTIRDLKGLDITGTNTHYEHIDTGSCQPGQTVCITFKQQLTLQNGPYSLSLGCTQYGADDFIVFARLYDILHFEVISHKHMVGFFDPQSSIQLTTEGQ